MTDALNAADYSSRIDLPNGSAIVLLDRLGKGDRYSNEELARNVFKIDAAGHVEWQVRSQFDAEGNPYTRLHYANGVTAYRWDGGSYSIDLDTGSATPLVLER
ncbi:MAG TPA: hypothetical protein VEZ48_02600 [Sphingomonadaceae bacterium]|nr:hypothetical protein [Sphingomonadaceae bacterium]